MIDDSACSTNFRVSNVDVQTLVTVQEMAPDKIVSEAAYVLFYRRRRLTPSNVINMTI